jgi:hypothetical protein
MIAGKGATAGGGDHAPRTGAQERDGQAPATHGPDRTVLANRMAAVLAHREPGWKLPRRSELARRFGASLRDIDIAVDELTRRSLLRRLPDGQVYMASPAEYRIPLEGVAGLATSLDPMGGQVTCQARHVLRRRAPGDIGAALGLAAGSQLRVVRCVWAHPGGPAAISTTYLPRGPAGPAEEEDPAGEACPGSGGQGRAPAFEAMLSGPPGPDGIAAVDAPGAQALRPATLHVDMRPPQPAVARSLRLVPGQPAVTVTIRFDDPSARLPAALTVVVLRPELIRLSIEAVPSRAS